jgi:hypothetical protein
LVPETAHAARSLLVRPRQVARHDPLVALRLTLWVPETVHAGVDLLPRPEPATGMIRRWRCD